MKKFLPFIILSLLLTQLSGVLAQISKGGFPPSYLQSQTLNGVEERIVRPENFPLIQQEDEENAKIGVVFRYGVWVDVNAGIENSGTWTVLPDGQRIWRLMITAPGAKAIAVHFDQFLLPEGAKVFVYNNTKDHIIGAFDKDNNHESRLLATELVKGEAIIIEYVAPPMNPEGFIEKRNTTDKEKQGFNPNLPLLSIGKIIYAYREVGFLFPGGSDSEKGCMVGINCSPEGSAWQDQKRGVARVSVVDGSGAGWCSGSLVNNVNGDCTPYFLLADHCGGTATSYMNQWVFYFNYEASSSNCDSETGPTNQSMSGATFKARGPMSGGSDFLLLQLNQALPSTYNLYVNGWNRGTTASSSGVSIHHPAGRVKKVSTYTQALSTYTYSGCMSNAHWLVYWAQTTNGHAVTEGGSSGSPIFDNNKRIVGTLTGGSSYCNAVTSPDMYGKMSTHWEANGTADNRRLRKWLDPNNTVTTLDGKYCGGGSSSSLVCTNAINLTCGQTYTGTTVGGASNVSTYNCQTWSESGPEKVHKIVTGSTGTITATLSGMGSGIDLDVFILSGCNETQCVASGDNSASYANAAAGTYYVVVDGYNGASGAYTLNVTCSGGGTPSSCDTISNVGSSESLTYYSPQSGWGFYPGHNSSTISAYADYYTNTGTKYIKHAWVPVAKAHAGSSSSSVVFKAWNGSGATPGNALGSKSFQINTFTVNQWKLIDFTTPIAVSGNFYFGFEINYGSPQDTFAVYCAAHRTSGTNTAFLYFNSAWQSFATAFSGNLNTSLGIEPVICTTVDVADYPELEDKIQVFPNPANDMVAIDFEFFKSNIEAIIIYDVIGKVKGEINPRDLENNKAVISLDSFDAGLYLISVKTKDKTVVNKFTVIK